MKLYVDKIVFLSSKTRDEFIANGIPGQKCFVIYNFSNLRFQKNIIEKKISRNKDILNLLFAGSIDKRKGIFDLISCIKENGIKCNLTICGVPIDKENETAFMNEIKECDDMHYLGYVSGDEKNNVFLNSDVLVLPSYGEGLPVVILEAFASGCGVIATHVGANDEIVKQENGILISPGNQHQLYEAIEQFHCLDYLRKIQANNFDYSKQFSLELFISNVVYAIKKD